MLDPQPDVVITGVAMTTALASSAEGTWSALIDGQSGIRPLSAPNLEGLDLPSTIGGQLRENLDDDLSRVEMRRLSFTQRMAIVLSRRAWADAGSPEVDTARLGVTVGTGLGSTEDIIIAYHEMQERGLKAVSPLAVQMYMPNGPAAAVGLDRKARAGVTAPLTGDVSGASAIAEAWRSIVFGDADVMICGGVELKLEGVPIAAYGQMDGVVSKENDDPVGACRPFDKSRAGMVLGEGGAMLIMETEEHARARGAKILARVLGTALSSDGYDAFRSDPDAEQEAHAITRALQLADLSPTDVGHVNAHATGTVDGDLVEAVAIRKVFGSHHPAVYASKAALGHSFGGAGAIEAVLSVLALRDGCIPPTLNFRELDSHMDLDVVAGSARQGDLRYAVSNSFGFGGHNAAIVFGRA